MVDEVRRDVVKLGIDFRPIPVDLGDGIEWDFHPDPNPDQWNSLVEALRGFSSIKEDSLDGEAFGKALTNLTNAMAQMLTTEEQADKWIEKRYGLGPQQAISEALMEKWTGFPTKQPSPSGEGSKNSGSAQSSTGT